MACGLAIPSSAPKVAPTTSSIAISGTRALASSGVSTSTGTPISFSFAAFWRKSTIWRSSFRTKRYPFCRKSTGTPISSWNPFRAEMLRRDMATLTGEVNCSRTPPAHLPVEPDPRASSRSKTTTSLTPRAARGRRVTSAPVDTRIGGALHSVRRRSKSLRVAMAQINPTVGDLQGNLHLIRQAIERGEEASVRRVILSELCISGYPPKDLLERPAFVRHCREALEDLAGGVKNTAALVGYPEENTGPTGKPVFNSSALLHQGKIVARVRKTLLPTYDIFDENRYFEPARR